MTFLVFVKLVFMLSCNQPRVVLTHFNQEWYQFGQKWGQARGRLKKTDHPLYPVIARDWLAQVTGYPPNCELEFWLKRRGHPSWWTSIHCCFFQQSAWTQVARSTSLPTSNWEDIQIKTGSFGEFFSKQATPLPFWKSLIEKKMSWFILYFRSFHTLLVTMLISFYGNSGPRPLLGKSPQYFCFFLLLNFPKIIRQNPKSNFLLVIKLLRYYLPTLVNHIWCLRMIRCSKNYLILFSAFIPKHWQYTI